MSAVPDRLLWAQSQSTSSYASGSWLPRRLTYGALLLHCRVIAARMVPRSTEAFVLGWDLWPDIGIDVDAPRQFMSNGGYSRNTLAAVTSICFVTVRGGRVSPASIRSASGSTS